jgi:beta-lactam-binding protein with PASTA domain
VGFKRPSNSKLILGEQRSIPDVSCVPVAEATSRLKAAGFVPTVGTATASSCPAGTAAGTVPSGRTVRGGAVGIQVSDGTPAAAGPGGG